MSSQREDNSYLQAGRVRPALPTRILSYPLSLLLPRGYLLVALSLVICPLAESQGTQQAGAATVVGRYIRALQHRDYKTIIDLTAAYQGEVARVKASNPQVLWPKLIDEYYQQKIDSFSKEGFLGVWPVYWRIDGDPTGALGRLRSLLPESCRWSITETRTERVQDMWSGRIYDKTTVYVSMEYSSWDSSPVLYPRFLKGTILQFDVDQESRLILGFGRISKGDVYWNQVPLTVLNVAWATYSLQGIRDFTISIVGGDLPYQPSIRCGSYLLETLRGAQVLSFKGGFVIHVSGSVGGIPATAFPLPCTLTVRDRVGAQDSVSFKVPRRTSALTDYFCWVREPWFGRRDGKPDDPCRDPIYALQRGFSQTIEDAGPSSTPQPSAASTGFTPPADSLTGVGPVGWLGRNPDFEPTPVHLGIDFVRQYGQPIFSIADGEIVLANTSVGSYGGVGRVGGAMIVKYKTDGGQTFYALYGHMENMKGPGCVGRGEQVGTIGHYFQKDGRDTPHLHFGIFFGDQLPTGDKWPWRQYVSDPSDAPGWQDPLFVLKNMRLGPLPCDSVSQAQTAEESRPDVAPPKVIAPPTPERQIQRFRVKHRHMGPDARGNVSFVASYCEGELRVTPEGNVEYICDRPDTVRSRCERGRFPPIKQVVLREDGGLRIMLMQGGNWDFYGSHADIKAVYEAISAFVTKRGP